MSKETNISTTNFTISDNGVVHTNTIDLLISPEVEEQINVLMELEKENSKKKDKTN